jgi:hypothetical protein
MLICMDDRLLSERFWWTTDFGGRWILVDDADLYGRPITKRAILVDDQFVWTTDLYGRPICMDDADLYGRPLLSERFWWTTRICMDDAFV